MALVNKRVGSPITISIGRRGEKPDLIPAKIVSAPVMTNQNGRTAEVATVITAQKNLAGETYLGERVHNLAFAFDRSERVELLDGTAEQPKSWQELIAERQRASLEYFATRPDSGAMDLSTLPE